MSKDQINLERARIRMARWRILRVLYSGRPLPVGEGLLMQCLDDADLPLQVEDIRRALQYLADKGWIELQAPAAHHWEARLLDKGVDFVEHHAPDDPAIARPEL